MFKIYGAPIWSHLDHCALDQFFLDQSQTTLYIYFFLLGRYDKECMVIMLYLLVLLNASEYIIYVILAWITIRIACCESL